MSMKPPCSTKSHGSKPIVYRLLGDFSPEYNEISMALEDQNALLLQGNGGVSISIVCILYCYIGGQSLFLFSLCIFKEGYFCNFEFYPLTTRCMWQHTSRVSSLNSFKIIHSFVHTYKHIFWVYIERKRTQRF